MRTDADLVLAARRDEAGAFGELFDRWFDRVYGVARPIVRNDDTAAEVAQESFLTIWQQLDRLEDPERFGGWALRIGRNKALNRLEKEQRSRPMEGDVMTGLHDGGLEDPTGSSRLIETSAISEVRDRQELVWAATAALGERDASLADLLLRHQLSPAEIAEEMGVEPNNAHQLLFRLRNKLGDAVANYLVWRNGRPRCDELRALLSDHGEFGADANRAVQRHAGRCEICSAERESVVEPEKLFASVPLLIAPLALKAKAAAALEAQGVPMGTASGGSGGPSGPGGAVGTAAAGSAAVGGVAGAVASEPPRRWPGRLLRGAAALAVVGLILLLFTRDIGDVEVVSTASTTTSTSTTTSSSTSTTTSTSTSSTTSTTTSSSTSTTVPAPVPPPPTDPPTVTAPPVVETTTTTTSTVPAPDPEIVRFSVRRRGQRHGGLPERPRPRGLLADAQRRRRLADHPATDLGEPRSQREPDLLRRPARDHHAHGVRSRRVDERDGPDSGRPDLNDRQGALAGECVGPNGVPGSGT